MKFCAMVSNIDSFLDNAKEQYEFWKNSYRKGTKEYSNHVSEIIKIFDLKGKNKFHTENAPKYWAGDISKRNPKFIIVSLNPGLKEDHRKITSVATDSEGWKTYMKNRSNWFSGTRFQDSKYWQKHYKFFCGMNNKIPEEPMDGDYILKNVLNLNLFPYHSNQSENFPSKFTVKQLEVVLHHLALVFDLIEEKKPRYCFFNGKVWKTLLIKHQLIDIKFSEPKLFKENKKGGKFSMYFGKKRRTRYVIFDKFLSRTHYYGVTDDDLSSDIPNFIKECLGS